MTIITPAFKPCLHIVRVIKLERPLVIVIRCGFISQYNIFESEFLASEEHISSRGHLNV